MSDESVPEVPKDPDELCAVLEAVLFAAPEPVTPGVFRKVFGDEVDTDAILAALRRLQQQTNEAGRGVVLEEVAGGWQFLTRPAYFAFVRRTGRAHRDEKLSPAALETLAIVAYKQPATRAEVDSIRGVASGPLLRALMDRRLIRVVGRAEIPGAPFQYGTTPRFLQHFGLRSIKDLPDPRQAARLLAEREGGAAS